VRFPENSTEDLSRHVQTTNVLDLDVTGEPVIGRNRACLPTSVSDITSWAESEDFSNEIGRLREGVAHASNMELDEKRLALAKGYLYFGFGAEAKETAALLDENHPSLPILTLIADTVDNGYARGSAAISDQLTCEGSVGFWAYLSGSDPNLDENTLNASSIMRYFSKLPAHLRHHLGPILAEHFRQANRPDLVESVFRLTEATGLVDSAELSLAKARHESDEGNLTDATEDRGLIVSSGSHAAVRALIDEVVQAFTYDLGFPPEKTRLLEGYMLEHRYGDLSADVLWATVVSHGLNSDFSAAFRVLSRQPGSPPDRVARDLLALLSKNGNDESFVNYAATELFSKSSFWASPSGISAANRMLSLGFPDVARSLLTQKSDVPHENDQRRMVRANSFLAEGSAREALREIIGASGGAANEIRAAAYEQLGDFSAASEIRRELGDAEEVSRIQWLHSEEPNWPNALNADPSRYDQLIGASRQVSPNQQLTQSDQLDTTLAASREIASQSVELRKNVLDLLGLLKKEEPLD
jgi:hypothetical protein